MSDLPETLPGAWWRNATTLELVVRHYGSFRSAERATGANRDNLRKWWHRHQLAPFAPTVDDVTPIERLSEPAPDGVDGEALLAALRKSQDATVPELADVLDTSPNRVRQAAARLRDEGYRIDLREGGVRLERIPPTGTTTHPDMLPLLDGTKLRIGVVSDTHQSSQECALDELHAAYDWFHREGVTQILHAGDWTCGRGIFRGQDSEIVRHTLDAQVNHLVDEYPQRDGVTTIGIAGNHDLEGEAGKVGFDPVAAFAARRPDIGYLGGYSAWVEVGAGQVENPPFVHLLHGKGGMSYAYSYKAQKLVDGYPGGRKPAILIPGHWHVRAAFEARSVQVMFPGCFEWQSQFMQRLGLHPAVGFHLLEVVVGPDGSVVQFLPRWFRFWQGRIVG